VRILTEPHRWERRKHGRTLSFPNDRRGGGDRGAIDAVRIDVIDNGPGISPEFHQEIFEEFLQIHQDSPSQGMGLGLAIARRLTEAHGGKIWVESKVGEGSTFRVLLPSS
jgi:signal transduction histidine kinase